MVKKTKPTKGSISDVSPELEALNQQITSLKDQLARSLADYVNLEKRIEAQRTAIAAMAAFSLVDKIISALDDLHLAQSHLNDKGLQLAIDKLINLLRSEGLSEIDALNADFDPSLMDCVEAVPGDKDKVIRVNKKGYLFNGQLLRPAQVAVGIGENIPQNSK